MLQAIRDGYLVEPRGYRITTGVSLDKVQRRAGDFITSQLAAAVGTMERNKLIVDAYIRYGQGLKAVVFTANIEHAVHVAREFNKRGVPAAAVWGEDPDREMKTKAHQSGSLWVICNVKTLLEGYDDPTIGCVILGRPSGSGLLVEQMIGRGLRLEQGINNLLEAALTGKTITKRSCIILDITDNTKKHKMSNLATLMGLPTALDMKGKETTEVVDEVEKFTKSHPDIDFSRLEDINNIRAYAMDIDLFSSNVKHTPMAVSKLRWTRIIADDKVRYLIRLPDKYGQLTVEQGDNGWRSHGVVRKSEFSQDGFATAEKGIAFADEMLSMLGRGLIQQMGRESIKAQKPASTYQ